MEVYMMDDTESEAIGILRVKAVSLSERSEFFESIKSEQVAKHLLDAAHSCSQKIGELILGSIQNHNAKLFTRVLENPSEMYVDCHTLKDAIAKFSVEWGRGKDPEFWERLWELDEEIAICFEEVKGEIE